MPRFTRYTRHQLDRFFQELKPEIYTEIAMLQIDCWWSREPLPFSKRTIGKPMKLNIGDKWGDLFDCAWFHFSGVVPGSAAGKKVVLLLDVNGEMCVVDSNGVPLRGLTNISSVFDDRLGGPGKRVLPFVEKAHGGEKVDVWADAGCNDLFGNLQEDGTVKQASIAICHEALREFYYDFEILLDLLNVLDEASARYQQIFTALNQAVHLYQQNQSDRLLQASAILIKELNKRGGDPDLQISAIGHAHLDLAWLWPVRETIRKGARTFATALELIERYPDYIYGASQPQLYLWMKNYFPELFAKIKQKVKQGRIEPLGASWVEFDTNITGGESIVRQLLYGKRFFRQEFGLEIDHLWQPDVFGYTASLPQLLKKSGIRYFMTQKLSWSLINAFPHHSFWWQGIDGSSVLTHMLPEETYNSPAGAFSINKIEKNYLDKDVSQHALLVFGIGDGGGGPGAEHLERLARLKNLSGLAPVVQNRVESFFKLWEKDADDFATWYGELYLERHQGTFTTQARSKWYNRKLEFALREWEWLAVINMQYATKYPQQELLEIWQEVLLYQFHDILPGSSIKRVYDESLESCQKLYQQIREQVSLNYRFLSALIDTSQFNKPALAANSLCWERSEWLSFDKKWFRVTVPPMAYAVVETALMEHELPKLTATKALLENDVFKIVFYEDGSIKSIFDKLENKQVLHPEICGNRLAVYLDNGDAWDIPLDYADTAPRYMQLQSAEARIEGPRAILRQKYRLGHSELVQDIVLTDGSRRIDFVTRLKWRETKSMLRTSFPVNIFSDTAIYEIQFGNISRPTHRNTTWELAKDEVPAQKWADLSQQDYGVALLNDSKYGYKIKDNVIDLNLLRSVPYPGPKLVSDEDVLPGEAHHGYTDQADHEFTYSLFPHPGDHQVGRVAHAAYELNVPLEIRRIEKQKGTLPSQFSFFNVNSPNIIIESVKKAEDDDSVIVRMYQSEKRFEKAQLKSGFPVENAVEVNLIEQSIKPLDPINESILELEFEPFEIKSVKLVFKREHSLAN